ncbi:hypothetical protein [Rhodovulum sp. P5]|uniref:hypothetical protein n=1 Tax=Rhodovulum sp. P5 TaxID=1564506 RepID=UPI0012EC280D|nr:hypothetical protein [Rhodovulum sp. P5]
MELAGFTAAGSFEDILLNPSRVPDAQGVYAVGFDPSEKPEFLGIGTGGFFKGQNPNVSVSELHENWVSGASVLYFGKAGGTGQKSNLRTRLVAFARFGCGKRAAHWGGRMMWQIANARSLPVFCRTTSDDPHALKRCLLKGFVSEYGRLPFANMSG